MKFVKKLGRWVVIAAILAAVSIVAFNVLTQPKDDIETMSVSIGSYINDIGELATAEYGFTMVQTATKPHKEVVGFKIPFTESKVIYSYEGLIKAGLDFEDIDIAVDDAAKTVRITLPEVRLLSTVLDRDSLIVYDEKNSPFNAFTFEDMNLSEAELEKSAEETAVNNGLLDRAADNAENIIRTMVYSMDNMNDYTVEFK